MSHVTVTRRELVQSLHAWSSVCIHTARHTRSSGWTWTWHASQVRVVKESRMGTWYQDCITCQASGLTKLAGCATSSRLDCRATIIYIDTNMMTKLVSRCHSSMRLYRITDDYECTSATASWSWGAHLHTFSSPEQSPVKSSPPAASSMVLTSFLEKSVPIPSNLEDSNQRNAEHLSVRNH